ncbi:hypothetical protein P8452_17958 [Trifolium repens]|nr:hypothetical protein P8452_17958 [Trifolium repens]
MTIKLKPTPALAEEKANGQQENNSHRKARGKNRAPTSPRSSHDCSNTSTPGKPAEKHQKPHHQRPTGPVNC